MRCYYPAEDGSSEGRVEAGFIRLACPHCLGHFVVDFKDNALSTVVAVVFLLVLAADDGESVHDVGHGVAWSREVALEFGEFLRGFIASGAFDSGMLYFRPRGCSRLSFLTSRPDLLICLFMYYIVENSI